ncbi:MAG: hypothetical protein MUE33_01190 [Cytophagaceae bacterium]|nr:hypothetical protein [Cytophagaceae bacterium]
MFDSLEAYCIHKKIDPVRFQEHEKTLWLQWEHEFLQVHPDSFTEQKKFLLNPIRRRFPLNSNPKDSTV